MKNRTVLVLLIVAEIICLLLCYLLVKPALNDVRKFFASSKRSAVETTQTTQSAASRQNHSARAQAPQFPADSKQDILADASATGVRPPVALSGTSKADVFKLRKEAVAASPFAREDYEPSQEVFGGIESHKPWIALNACWDIQNNKSYTQGPSEETRFINNPTALIALEMPFPYSRKASWCTRADTNLLIQKIAYDGSQKEIAVTYLNLPFPLINTYAYYTFNGLNARDLGYPYMYVDLSKSSYKLKFVNQPNAATQVVKLENFIHVGSSCRASGGCNNGSPHQPMLDFQEDTQTSTQDREIYIKLWKENPASVDDPADMVERIIIKGKTAPAN